MREAATVEYIMPTMQSAQGSPSEARRVENARFGGAYLPARKRDEVTHLRLIDEEGEADAD